MISIFARNDSCIFFPIELKQEKSLQHLITDLENFLRCETRGLHTQSNATSAQET